MSSLAIRSLLRRPLYRLAIVLAVLAVGGAVVEHHAVPDMAGMAACVFVVGGTAVVVAAVATLRRTPLLAGPLLPLPTAPVLPRHAVPARAGPLYLALLVLRR